MLDTLAARAGAVRLSIKTQAATLISAYQCSREWVILDGIAWERIAFSFSSGVETSWLSLSDFPEGQPPGVLPRGQALAVAWSESAHMPRASHGHLVMPPSPSVPRGSGTYP